MRCPSFCRPRAEPLSADADSRSAGNSLMSAPATNALSPPPRSTIARVPSSPSSRSISASSSSSSAEASAFMGGLSIVTTATAPSCSVLMNVPMVSSVVLPVALWWTRARHGSPYGAVTANRSRSAVLRNLPTAVFGISSTNSKRSGSHHFAK